tara:strand:- start:133 stop:273 length:141 start_codon:yes stop_codon:yes gene_type:complete
MQVADSPHPFTQTSDGTSVNINLEELRVHKSFRTLVCPDHTDSKEV